MSYMVNFRSAEGKPGYHPTDTLEEAVRFVEHLRNQEHVNDARVWRLHEVPIEVRTYYKVEVVTAGAEPTPARAEEESPRLDPVAVPAAPAEASGAPGAPIGPGNGPNGPNGARFGRFNRT